jgi:probable HAF family extracellular repeat protein
MKAMTLNSKGVHSTIKIWRFMAVSLAGLVLLTSSASAQPHYALTDLGIPTGIDLSMANGINDNGDVAGACNSASVNQVAYVWRNGLSTSLGKLPGGTYSYATAINLSGVVVGDGDTGDGRPQSWVTTPSGLFNFFPNSGGNTHAIGINNAGVICGYYTKSLSGNVSSWRGAIWSVDPKDPTRYRETDLPVIPGNNSKYTSAIPFAFNQSGQAAGWAVNDIIGQHASFWNNDAKHSIADLGVFPGDWSSIAWGMNDLGQVVGESHPPGASRPVLWNNDAGHTPLELPLLSGDNYGTATKINNLGHILGSSALSDSVSGNVGPARLVIWRDGGVFEIQPLLDASSAGWRVSSVTAINDSGQIAGFGTYNAQTHGFVLTPLLQ